MTQKFYQAIIGFVILIACGVVFAEGSQKKLKPLLVDFHLSSDIPIKAELKDLAMAISKDSKSQEISNEVANRKIYWESQGISLFTKLLKSYGYYSAIVEAEEIPEEAKISFLINPGERYFISKIIIEHNYANTKLILPKISDLKIKEKDFAIAGNILADEGLIFEYVQEHNCLIHLNVSHFIIVNQIEHTIEVHFFVSASDNANISEVYFEGLNKVNPEYARKLVKIDNGICYKNSTIIKAQNQLQKSGLFSSATPLEPKFIDEKGMTPVVFKVRERQDKTVKIGLNYITNFGTGVNLGWRHRNLFSQGEDLDAELSGNKKEQSLDVIYIKPFYQRDDQTLKLGAGLENKESKAFNSKKGTISAGIERKINELLTVGLGAEYSLARITKEWDYNHKEQASIFGMPIFIARDSRNNIMDPHEGNMLRLETSPYARSGVKRDIFVKNKLIGTAYFSPFNLQIDPVIAFRASAGTILAGKKTSVPKTEQFFVGGSNSVRGYDNQLAGVIDKLGKPAGGLSFVETSVELRTKLKGDFGLVLFVDGGRNYQNRTPNFKEKLFFGAGFGVRYYTAFGPLRADIAFPLHKRKKIDDSYNLYFNIGQSF